MRWPAWLALAATVLLPNVSNAQAPVQTGSMFNNQGPAPRTGPIASVQTADAPPNGTEAGAIQAILPDPALGATTMFAGSVNGGIWITSNGGTTWTPLTSTQSSLSIASMTLDPSDPSGKTIIAGTGVTSNGFYDQGNIANQQGRGGLATGLLYSTDGGASWSLLGNSVLQNQSVIGVQARGSTILAATFEEQSTLTTQTGPSSVLGLYRSGDGGKSFSLVSGTAGSGLPNGAVTSLVGDPSNPSRFYAAVTSATTGALNQTAVYVSDNLGQTWRPVFTTATNSTVINNTAQSMIQLATGPNGSVAIVVSNGDKGDGLTAHDVGAFLSQDGGNTWHQLAGPNVTPGQQAPGNLHIAIDPNNPNFVYISGDAHQNCDGTPSSSMCSLFAVRVTYNPATGTSASAPLTVEGTFPTFSDASTVHADSRAMAFDSQGRLILTSDGGVYLRNNPQGSGAWQGLNGNLSVFEGYQVAFDSNSKLIVIAAQDNGSSLQTKPGSSVYRGINFGDGINAAVNDQTLTGLSAIYTTEIKLGNLSRLIVNPTGAVKSPFPDPTNPAGVSITCTLNGVSGRDCGTATGAFDEMKMILNKVDRSMIAIGGGNGVYVTADPLTPASVNQTSINWTLTAVSGTGPSASTIAYGTNDNVNALLVGGTDGSVWRSTISVPSLVQLTNYAGLGPLSVSYDLRTERRFFVADSGNLWYVTNGNAAAANVAFTSQTLPGGFTRPMATEFISSNGVNAILVGGLNTVQNCQTGPGGCVVNASQSPIVVADSDRFGNLSTFRYFGQGLPNTFVDWLSYNATADTLVASVVGRGVWTLYDVTSNFSSATVLQFGLANNDSVPDPQILRDGDNGARQLIKYGTGTLTIAGDATYTGGTVIRQGALVIGAGGASGNLLGNIAFCTNAADPGCDTTTNKFLAFNRSDIYTFGGSITGAGQVIQEGSGTTILSGQSTYTGSTTVNAGTLSVTGSIASAVFVNAGGVLSGSGTVGSTTINAGGLLAPANPGGVLTVQGNFAFATGGAYLAEINNSLADRVNVTGGAALSGSVIAALLGSSVSKQYTILNAAGGITGTFAGVNNLPATLAGNLTYDPNNVVLNLSLNYNALGNLNANQQNVASALANFFNSNGSIPLGFATLTQAGLSQVAGEAATGSQQTTFQAMTQFINSLLDPFIGGRETVAAPAGAANYAEDTGASAYAASGRALSQNRTLSENERAAYAAVFTKAPLRQLYDPHWSVWASAFGGSQTTDGNAAVGSNSATSRIFGMAAGADYLLSPRTIAGFALAGGGTNFSVANSGSGRSDLFQAGAFIRHHAGPAYVSAAVAYGWQDVTTDRMVMADRLHAEFNANALSGRVEGGYRVATRWIGITPYAAAQVTSFFLPAYAESVVFGTTNFPLGYAAQTVTDTRTELGFRTDRSFALQTGLLTLRSRIAWAHDYNPDRAVVATFQALPGASFVVNGAAQASESALTTASAEMKWRNGWSAAATFEGEFSKVTASYAGKGVVRYAW